ncbi:hypothetical protein F0562_031021 [Nyssa sinensis]|uniref:Growth-regulating factor n=1 Tax=Nyssa sinensis TaxID=561372 RepID=A0A5J5AR39_9ASTE|nr:hypothetical protein F0562_031021 [Nyssa sinensis]
MENGSVGISNSDTVSVSALESDVGLALKFQSTESSPFETMRHHHQDHHRPLSSPSETIDGGGGGPTSNSGANEGPCSLLIFSTTSHTAFKSPGGMAATLGFPFTSAQWKELERQAMIYKYMMASVPVPPDLLSPITRNLCPESYSHLGNGSVFNLRFSNNKDIEPGRCKRTDGKKWRCSRDVAPHQKYCERHMHKGRPRSRKPVEVNSPITTTTAAADTKKKTRIQHHAHPTTPTVDKSAQENISTSSYKEPSRSFGWMMEGDMVTMDTSEQQWKHLMRRELSTEGSIYNTGATFFRQDYREEPLNLISYTDFGAPESDQQNSECSIFFNPDLVSLEKEPQENPRGFIDAWSKDNANASNSSNRNEPSVFSPGNLSPSSLNLSMAMAAGNTVDEEMGGPLAEVLRPGGLSPASSPYTSNGVSASTPPTTVSSPSGVLHRKMFSLSDSSDCNSPTLAASTAPPEITAFQWLS